MYISAIVDGVHLAPETVQLAARSARERFVLITDAISAAGRPDGTYALGDRTVILGDGACRLENGTLAGSSLTMDRAVRNMIELGFAPHQAIAAATSAPAALAGRPELELTVQGLETYSDHDKRAYIHFVDGGITDNLGIRSLYEIIELSGGVAEYSARHQRVPPKRLVLISVNAATDPARDMDRHTKQPSFSQVVGAVSDVQLHRYNVDTIALLKASMERWAQELSKPGRLTEPYFILLDFHGIQDVEQRLFLNQTPTSFSLTDEQVDGLIEAGGELLRNDPEFRRLLSDMAAEAG